MQFIKSVLGINSSNNEKLTFEESKSLNKMEPSYSLFFDRLENHTIPQFAGLRSKNYSTTFQLTDFQVDAVVNDATVTTVFTQRYQNNSTTPVEANYQMPLSPTSAVCDFVVKYDDKVLKAKIKEKEAAAAKYNDAIASGNQAFLVEKKSNGTFTTTIGNIPPTKEVTVSVTIISEIGTHIDSLHFGLHRYMFPNSQFKLTLNLNVQLSTPIKSIQISDYKSDIDIKGNSATVHCTSDKGVPKNLIAVIKPEVSELPSYYLEKSKDSYAIGLNYYPHLQISPDEIDQCSEFIFLIDCSGSMDGDSIQKAKSCLEILMRSLTFDKSKFNIWLFGSEYKSLFPTSRIYNDETLEEASNYIPHIGADLGGTELLPPIQAILRTPVDPKYPRQVFILTDGEVSERDNLVDFVAKGANTTRIFTLGIGSGVDRMLVLGLSKACKGYYEFIDNNDMMETQVMSLMSIAMEPIIANIQVNWDGLPVTQGPKSVRPIFNHERMFIYGLLENIESAKGTKNIVITADGPTGSQVRYEIPIDFDGKPSKESNSIHTLTANLIIRDLEDEEKTEKNKNKDEIVRLGKKFNLISNHTSFIVVSESETPTEETMQTIEVVEPQVKPDMVHYLLSAPSNNYLSAPEEECDDLMDDCDYKCDEDEEAGECLEREICVQEELKCSIQSQISTLQDQCYKAEDLCAAPVRSKSLFSFSSSKKSRSESYSEPAAPPQSNQAMMDIIRSQKANGSWSSVSFKVPKKPSELGTLSDEVWLTFVVIATLSKTYSSQKTQWQQIVIKATKWIKSQLNAASLSDKFDNYLSLAQSSI